MNLCDLRKKASEGINLGCCVDGCAKPVFLKLSNGKVVCKKHAFKSWLCKTEGCNNLVGKKYGYCHHCRSNET